MPTYRELYEKLSALSAEQLDREIKIIPVGYTDSDAAAIFRYDIIPQVLELAKASKDLYYCHPTDEEDWVEPGIMDFSESEIEEMGIDKDEDYVRICKKGEIFFKVRDNIAFVQSEEVKPGNIDTSIMPL